MEQNSTENKGRDSAEQTIGKGSVVQIIEGEDNNFVKQSITVDTGQNILKGGGNVETVDEKIERILPV